MTRTSSTSGQHDGTHPADEKVTIGGSRTIREGQSVAIVACGVTVDEAFEAAERLAQEGIGPGPGLGWSCTTVWTRTGATSSSRSSRASGIASRWSVFTRSPDGRCNFYGAATTHRTPAADTTRARSNPVGPASQVTAHGPSLSAIHDKMCP